MATLRNTAISLLRLAGVTTSPEPYTTYIWEKEN
jgi:hypothetical protein